MNIIKFIKLILNNYYCAYLIQFLGCDILRIIKFFENNCIVWLTFITVSTMLCNWAINPSSFIDFTKSSFSNKFYIFELVMGNKFHFPRFFNIVNLCMFDKIINNFVSTQI